MDNKKTRKVQLVEVEILNEIDRICKKHKIKYFLVGGTLLGAVRHKGFIPWDDDIDIAMLRDDYDKFINICLNTDELSDQYFMHSDITDDNYWLPYIKVRKNNTTFSEKFLKDYDTHKGIFVDIFPLENIKKEKGFFQKLRALFVKSIGETIYYKKDFWELNNCRRKSIVFVFNLFSTKFLKKLRDKLLLINRNKKTEYVGCIVGAYSFEKEIFKNEFLFPLKTIEFEGNKYPCFKNVDYYLTKLYSDYMQLPPEEKRITHLPEEISFTKGKNLITRNEKKNEN